MTNVEKLLAMGAHSVGPDLIFKNQVMGTTYNGSFLITPEGEALCQVEDTPFREVKKPAKKKPEAAEAPEVDPNQLTLDLE